jgi:outer membrane protein TolC
VRLQKKLLGMLLVTLFVFITYAKAVLAQESIVEDNNIQFTLQESIEKALRDNISLKILNENYNKAIIERKEAKSKADKIEEAQDMMKYYRALPGAGSVKLEQMDFNAFSFEGYQAKDVLPKLKKAEELILKKNLELEKRNLSIEVTKLYFNVLLAQDNLKNAKIQLERSKTQLKNAQLSFEQGISAQDAVLMAQANLSNSYTNLYSAEKRLQLAQMNLNKIMGRELTAPIELTTQFAYKPEILGDVEEMVKEALTVRPEVISVRAMRDVAKESFDPASSYYTSNTYIYQKAKIDLEKANLAVIEAEESVKLAVRAAYLKVEEAAKKLEAATKFKETAQESYRITELMAKSQVATIIDVLAAQEKLYQAELAYSSAVLDYNIAKAELDNWVGKELM